MYQTLDKVTFPEFQALNVNMMPIIMGDKESIPKDLRNYWSLIQQCDFKPGSIVYLTIDEREVPKGKSHRRGGIHTEGFVPEDGQGSWGGGWGNQAGLYMASTDGACRLWDTETWDVNSHGQVLHDLDTVPSVICEPNRLYWLTDRVPHESLPTEGKRQFFRLVSEQVSVWFAQHNTPNPLGVLPQCKIVTESKF